MINGGHKNKKEPERCYNCGNKVGGYLKSNNKKIVELTKCTKCPNSYCSDCIYVDGACVKCSEGGV